MKSSIPTPEEGRAFERFHSYRHGWTDGASGRAKNPKFAEHATRVDLIEMYARGFAAGEVARSNALRGAAEVIGYVPSILREAP